jgi:hypothetical protein
MISWNVAIVSAYRFTLSRRTISRSNVARGNFFPSLANSLCDLYIDVNY